MQWLIEHVSHEGDDCLVWPYARNPDGRGVAYWNGNATGASRQMCVLAHGEPPSRKHFAMVTCGNGTRGCVNPRHLAWETVKDSGERRPGRGVGLSGERSPNAKLDAATVRAIRRLGGKGQFKASEIARMFKISTDAVHDVIKKRRWAQIAD